MTTTSNGNEPAFPTDQQTPGQEFPCLVGGLTKRELFAAMAMQGFCANTRTLGWEDGLVACGEWSVKQADALLAALATEGKKGGE